MYTYMYTSSVIMDCHDIAKHTFRVPNQIAMTPLCELYRQRHRNLIG